MDEVDWVQEITTACLPYSPDFLKAHQKKFTKNLAGLALAGDILNYNRPKVQNAIGNIAIFAHEGYDAIKIGLQKLDSTIKIKGLSTGVSYCDAILFGKNLYETWSSKDKSFNQKVDKTSKSVYETAGGIIGANLGKAAGAFIGNLICPVAGGVIGGVLGTIAGSVVGNLVGGVVYDGAKWAINKGIEFFSGIAGIFRSGGVEFCYPKKISGFNNSFSFDQCHFTAFEYDSEKNFSVNDIINLVNDKFLIGNIKVENLNEIYDTILKEVSYGFLYKKKLPSISLNFNKGGLLYSIMDDYYKSTITGNILTFLDYYLKSYVNGGFFKEEFVFNWQIGRNENRDYLQKNLIDFKKYLYDLTHNPDDINYCSMYDFIGNSNNKNDYISAFRIIGYLDNNLKYYKNLIFPDCSYFTQYDFDILPEWEAKIDIDNNEKINAESIRKFHKIMSLRVTLLMNKIPFLKPYFELLKMITFAIHYLPNIQSIGLFPLFNNSLQNKYMGEKYCKSIPKVFPPLPIRKKENIKMNFTLEEFFKLFENNNYNELNQFISICYYETREDQLDEAVQKQKHLLDKIKNYIKDKVKSNINEQDKYIMNFFSEENLRIPKILKEFIDLLFFFPISYILKYYQQIYVVLDKQENKLYKPKNPQEYIIKIKYFNELKKEVEEILNIFSIYLMEFFEKYEDKLNKKITDLNKEGDEKIKSEIVKLNERAKKMIKEKFKCNEQKVNELMNKKEIKDSIKKDEQNIINNIEKQKKEMIQKNKLNFENKKNELNEIIDKLNSQLSNLQNKLIYYNVIDKESIEKNKKLLTDKLSFELIYTKASFEDKDENQKYNPIRGGCLPEINNNIYLSKNEEINEDSYNNLINTLNVKNPIINNKQYFVVKTELRNGFIYDNLLYHLTKTIDINKMYMQLAIIFNNDKEKNPNFNNLKDISGNSMAFQKILLNKSLYSSIPTKKELEISNIFGEKAELYAVAIDDPHYLKQLISLPYSDFSAKTEGGLTPLALSLINDTRNITKILLDSKFINKNGDLNFSNELGLTLLHLAVVSNDDYAFNVLLNNGGDISIANKKESNTPIHLIGIYARNEIILNIYRNQNFIKNVNNQRPDGKNALHFMSGNSILGTKLLLCGGAEKQTFDKFGNTQARYAFYFGRFDCYNLLLNGKGNKFDLSLKENLNKLISYIDDNMNENMPNKNNLSFEFFKSLFEKNNYKNIKSIIDEMKKANKKLNDKDIYCLIDIACKNRNIGLLKYISEISPLKKYHIGPYIGKYGLISWLREISNFGIDILTKSEDVLNGKNIFHFCLLNDDKKLLKHIFRFINKPSENFENEISELFCNAFIESKINIIEQIEKELENSKFNKIKISLKPLVMNINLTLTKLKFVLNNYPKIDIKSIDIKEVMKYSRPNILDYLLDIKKVKDNMALMEELKYIAIENNRFDNLFTLLRKYPKLDNDILDINYTTQKLIEIEELLNKNNSKNFGVHNILEKKIYQKLNNINIGLIKLPVQNQYLPHLIIKSNNLWAFKSLKNIYKNDIFFVDDESKTCFDYLKPNIKIDEISFENLDIVVKYFGKDYENILNVIEVFTVNLRVLNIQCEVEYIKFIFSSFPDEFFIAKNKNSNSIFHIIGCLNLNFEVYSLIIEKLIHIKNNYKNKFNEFLNLQNINGNTFLMIFLEKENYDVALEVINKFIDDIQFNIHNYLGNSILHILFLQKNFNKNSNNFIAFEKIYQLLLQIIKKGKNLIISKNREDNTPYILAANSGCNLAIRIMIEFYNIQYLESFSEFTTALHQACINENINTVRFLIEVIHYDPNVKLKKNGKKNLLKLPEGSTPLHAASQASSIEVFEYLILHGGDPFIEDKNGNDSFDIAYKHGNHQFIKYIFNLNCSKVFSYNDKYLLSLVQNKQKGAINIFYEYIKINNFENYNIVNENMDTLLINSCRAGNVQILSTLINNGINPLIKNKQGNNCLHICAYKNSFSCSGVILSKLEKNEIEEILNCKNDIGTTPLHIAAENNFENLSHLFISFLIKNGIQLQLIKNNAGLTPLQLAIKKHNYKIALIYIKYLDLNISDLLMLKNLNIENEYDDFMYSYDSGLLNEYEKEIDDKFKNINYYKNEQNTFPEEYKKQISTQIKFIKDGNISIHDEMPKYKSYDFLHYNLFKYYKYELFTEELFFENNKILGNIYVILTLIRLAKNGKKDLINFYFSILTELKVGTKKFMIENNNDNNNNNNELYNFIELFSILAMINISEDNLKICFDFLQDLISIFKNRNLKDNNEFLKFMKSCIISYFDCKFIKSNINEFLNELNKLKNIILYNEDYINKFKYTSSAFHTYQFLFKLNKILYLIKNESLKIIQIEYLNKIPCLFNDEIEKYLNKYHILHEFILLDIPLYDFAKLILQKSNDDIYIIKDGLSLTQNVVDCHELQEKEKKSIIQNIISIYNTFIKNKQKEKKMISSLFKNFFLLSKQIILHSNISSYESILKEVKSEINTFEELIQYLYLYSSPKEINFPNFDEKLRNILSNIQLNEDEKKSLSTIAELIPKYCEKYKYMKEFKKLGKEYGIKFKQNPNLENLANLISIITLGVSSALNISPYLIQCLSVSSFLLHYIDLKNDPKIKFKGKLAQIKTGEGKSLIIAMLSLSNALMGNFVDVITSTHYLAERDQKKFKNFYLQFGVTSSNIVKNNPSKSDYNGVIIYGTNTDFEFSLLREGIYKKKKLYTVPLYSDDILIERTYDVAIVDECDNLFLDTAQNSARISHPSKSSYNWLYPIIYKYFCENEKNVNIAELKNIISNYENQKYKEELEKINDDKLKELLKSAKIAKGKKLNLDYVIGYNEELSLKQIQIVSLDTGRIQYGSRWTNGIHEFIEVKEGIEPETESNVIGSISHPTYFEGYKILFGLTGTIGDEIERNEIEEIYKVKCYDIPRNFKENLKNENMEIYDNKKEKFNRILNIIKENKNKKDKAQPILIILENIDETLEFGKLLRNLKFDFFILNDIQKENEDYILNNVGHSGNILVATNAAGRGTDIIIDDNSKRNGGLYVIVGFFPQNSRIEFQAIGRAGRQGNPGNAKIIISKDEDFTYYNYFLIKQINQFEDNIFKALYNSRKIIVEDISKTRINFCKKERIYFYTLKKYFIFKQFMILLFENNLFKFYYEIIMKSISYYQNLEYYKNFTLMQIDNVWSEFYSDFVKERGNKKIYFDCNKNYFIEFLDKFELEWINCMNDIYRNDNKKIKYDLMNIAIKNIKIKISNIKSMNIVSDDYIIFRKVFENLKLRDIIKYEKIVN